MAAVTTAAVLASYLLLYSAYSKASQSLSLGLLLDILLVRRSVDFTLVELNKALSLAGLTVLGLAFVPGYEEQSKGLTRQAMLMLWMHSAYSSYKFMGSKLMPHPRQWAHAKLPTLTAEGAETVKLISVALGSLGQMSLVAGNLLLISRVLFAYGAISLGTAHFYTMEIDYKGKLGVRPYAYVAFAAAAAGLLSVALGLTE